MSKQKALESGSKPSLRELLAARPQVGSVVTVAVPGLGNVGVRIISTGQAVALAMERVEGMGKAAASLGMTAQAYTRLAHAANMADMSAEGLSTGMKMMLNNLADAANGTGAAKATFDQLGLSAQQLASMSPDKALGLMADALNQVGNAAEKNNLAMNIFGRQAGPELNALLSGGSAGLDEMAQQADKLGVTFNDVDAAKIQQANDAMKEISSVITGVFQKAAIELAPYIRGIANELTNVATAGGGLAQYVLPVIEGIAKGVAIASDFMSLFESAWYVLKAGVLISAAGILYAIDAMGSGIVKLANLIPGVKLEWTSDFKVMADSVADDAAKAWESAEVASGNFANGKNQEAVTDFFDKIKKDSQKSAESAAAAGPKIGASFSGTADTLSKVTDAMGSLNKEIEQFGMNDLEKKLADFSAIKGLKPQQLEDYKKKLEELRHLQAGQQIGGVQKELDQFGMTDTQKRFADMKDTKLFNDEQLKQLGAMLDRLDKAQQGKAMDDKVKSWRESMETPMQKFQKQVDELAAWETAGKISAGEFDQGVDKARKDAFGDTKTPEAIRAGSYEAQKMAYENSRGMSSFSKDEIPKKQLVSTERSKDLLDRIERNTRSMSAGNLEEI